MKLEELKYLVDLAIDDCQSIITRDSKTVLSESDYERLLANCIARRINYVPEKPEKDGFSIHTQITLCYNESK